MAGIWEVEHFWKDSLVLRVKLFERSLKIFEDLLRLLSLLCLRTVSRPSSTPSPASNKPWEVRHRLFEALWSRGSEDEALQALETSSWEISGVGCEDMSVGCRGLERREHR